MGNVVDFRTGKPFKPTRREPWRYEDLKGDRPEGHPELKRGSRGKVLLDVDQVWVEIHSDRLWVLTEMWEARKTFYPHNVFLLAYKGSDVCMLAETGLRATMRVWDEWAGFKQECMTKFEYCAVNDPSSPWRGRPNALELARQHFDIDKQGNRIRD